MKTSVLLATKPALHSWPFVLAIALALGSSIQIIPAATLTHRYSFDTDASDSVGTANGVLQGNAYITNGALVLDGTNSSVQLPDNLFTNYNSLSFELWFSPGIITRPQTMLYCFGTSPSGTMFYKLQGQGGCNRQALTLPSPPVSGVVHLVWTQDSTSQTARLYVNGILAGQNTNFTQTPSPTTGDYIGGIGGGPDTYDFQGNIWEFRVWQSALSPLDVAVADALGSDQPQLNPGTLQDVRVITPPSTGPGALFRLGVYADFANVTNVNISTQPDLVLSSGNTNVIVITPDQRLQTVGFGVADITASYDGLSNTVPVTVGTPQDVALIHRYDFNEQTNDWIVHDSVVNAGSGVLRPGSGYYAFTGQGELILNGSGGYVALPSGLISCLSELSIEAWVTCTLSNASWQRIFDFGNQNGIMGQTYLYLTSDAATTNGAAQFTVSTNSITGEAFLDWTNSLPVNMTSFVAVTYSPVRGVVKFYINGQSVAVGTASIPLSAIIDTNDWLGRSQYAFDSYFGGRYNEFRIYRGLLSDADVAADYAAGPNVVGVDYVLHDFQSGNSLNITWGTTATNWFLESSPALGAGAVWTAVTNTPTLQNGRYNVTVPISSVASYFRLHAPP